MILNSRKPQVFPADQAREGHKKTQEGIYESLHLTNLDGNERRHVIIVDVHENKRRQHVLLDNENEIGHVV